MKIDLLYDIKELDDLYTRYGYSSTTNHKGAKVYVYTKSIYPGADIIKTSEESNIDLLKKEYQEQGYGVKIRDYSSLKEAEEILFSEFFKADGVKISLKKKYNTFIDRIMMNLPQEAKYEYINSPYEINEIDSNGAVILNEVVPTTDSNNNLIKRVLDLIENKTGALFVVIEAAAGFGKTCSAYEILNKVLEINANKVPFFTELSRDRTAAIFKHILQNEIEEQFSGAVNSKVVIQEIKNGRIPLIIDGFDELISKDFSFSSTDFQQVESMLSTILDLLSDNAKIIITSRKTAIFNSSEFFDYIENRGINYNLVRISINEPSINDWLSNDQLEILEEASFPIQSVSNPVLLTFLKHTSIEELQIYTQIQGSIVDIYIHFLLEREQTRQDLPMDIETQLRIYRKLVRLFTEFDIKSASKEDLKSLILEYNKKLLEEFIKLYPSDRRRRIDQVADTLTNHAFLDKKDGKNIGFINEFIFGTLIGQNLVNGKFQEHQANFQKFISQQFAILAIEAYKVQPHDSQYELWKIFDESNFNYDSQFYFKLDIDLQGKTYRNFKTTYFEGYTLNNQYFINQNQFDSITFAKCTFNDCSFKVSSFKNCGFVNCTFFNCTLEVDVQDNCKTCIKEMGCTANNKFIEQLYAENHLVYNNEVNVEEKMLELFFKQGSLRPRHRLISHIKDEFPNVDEREINKLINRLKSENILQFNGDLGHLTTIGIKYFNEKYRN